MKSTIAAARTALSLCALAACILLGAELGARLDDWLFERVALTANPSSDDLITRDERGRRGEPNARFKKWRLNNFGFRGPDIALEPRTGTPRILILGASETFGLYESPDSEYPALLRTANRAHLEIINTAVVGMGLPAMTLYWQRQLNALRPDEVLIYPSPLFYLADEPVSAPKAAAVAPPPSSTRPNPPLRSRFLDRLRGFLHKPDFLQIWLDRRAIESELAARPGERMFQEVPPERLDAFQSDLEHLVEVIQASGARVRLMTHAIRLRGDEPDLENAFAVWEERVYTPRASGQILVAFNSAANQRLRAVAAARGVGVIDVSAAVSGCHACFGDLVHFTDLGAQKVAATIQRAITTTDPDGAGHAVQ